MTEWTKKEDEAFNAVERQSNLGKQILKSQGQPYHWQIDAIESAIRMEREECANTASLALLGADKELSDRVLKAIRTRGQA
jgi:hypothetical protein